MIFQTKEVLSEDELAESLRRTLARAALLPPQTSALVKQAIAFIQQHYSDPLSRQEIADALGVNKDYLGRIFTRNWASRRGSTSSATACCAAKNSSDDELHRSPRSPSRVGFDTATYFSHIFHREVGCSPRAFRQQRTP